MGERTILEMSQAIRPFEYLETLAQYALRYCAEIPDKDAGDTQWSGMGFTLGGYPFVVALNDISKVLPVPAVTPLPGVKPWAKGIANVQSRLIPVVDLTEFLTLEMPAAEFSRSEIFDSENNDYQPVPKNRRIITIERRDISVALIVDEVQGVIHFSGDHYQDMCPDTLPEPFQPFAQGSYQQDREYVVFGVEQLISNKQFLNATLD